MVSITPYVSFDPEVNMAKDTRIFVGLDVHKNSIVAACAGSDPDEPVVDVGTVGTQQYAIDRLLKKLFGRGRLRLVYEAGPGGFWLQRYLTERGYDCRVAAPSLIPQKPGERSKTDRRDTRKLCLALRAGTLLIRQQNTRTKSGRIFHMSVVEIASDMIGALLNAA
jgi:transposase